MREKEDTCQINKKWGQSQLPLASGLCIFFIMVCTSPDYLPVFHSPHHPTSFIFSALISGQRYKVWDPPSWLQVNGHPWHQEGMTSYEEAVDYTAQEYHNNEGEGGHWPDIRSGDISMDSFWGEEPSWEFRFSVQLATAIEPATLYMADSPELGCEWYGEHSAVKWERTWQLWTLFGWQIICSYKTGQFSSLTTDGNILYKHDWNFTIMVWNLVSLDWRKFLWWDEMWLGFQGLGSPSRVTDDLKNGVLLGIWSHDIFIYNTWLSIFMSCCRLGDCL